MEARTGLIGLGLGLGLGYLIWKDGAQPSSSKQATQTKCPPCDPTVGARGCEAGSKDAVLTIADFKNRNSTWIPGLLPQVLAKLNLLSVSARSDNFDSAQTAQWKLSYRECFGSTLATFGLAVDEDGKVTTK